MRQSREKKYVRRRQFELVTYECLEKVWTCDDHLDLQYTSFRVSVDLCARRTEVDIEPRPVLVRHYLTRYVTLKSGAT